MRFTASYYHLTSSRLRALNHPDVQLPQLLLRHGRGRAHQQILGVLRHRERDHFAQIRLLREQHHDAIDAGREPAVRRRAVAERVEHAAEPLLHLSGP